MTKGTLNLISALETYVRSQINVADNQELVFDFKAGRGDYGPSATLDIVPAGLKAVAASDALMSKAAPSKDEKAVAAITSAPAAAVAAAKPNITATPEARTEPKAEPVSQPVAKPSFNIGKKPEPVAEPKAEAEAENQEDEGASLDDRGNSMTW